jgi:hypothetical protein
MKVFRSISSSSDTNKSVSIRLILFVLSFIGVFSVILFVSNPQREALAMPQSKPVLAYGDYVLAHATTDDNPAGKNACPKPAVFRAGYRITSYLPVNREVAGIRWDKVVVKWYWLNADLRPVGEPFAKTNLGSQNDPTEYSLFWKSFSKKDAGKRVGVYMATENCMWSGGKMACGEGREIASGWYRLISHNARRPSDAMCPKLKGLSAGSIIGVWKHQGSDKKLEIIRAASGNYHQYIGIETEKTKYYRKGEHTHTFSLNSVNTGGINLFKGRHIWITEHGQHYWSDEGTLLIELRDRRTFHMRWLDAKYKDGWTFVRVK